MQSPFLYKTTADFEEALGLLDGVNGFGLDFHFLADRAGFAHVTWGFGLKKPKLRRECTGALRESIGALDISGDVKIGQSELSF